MTDVTPSLPTPVAIPVFPVAAIVCVVVAVFLLLVLMALILRKYLLSRGLEGPGCSLARCCPHCEERCGEGCRVMAEKLDCRTPDCRAWLDSVCPTKERCVLLCGQLWSCYCCHMAADSCKEVTCCPDCQAIECPDCECGGDWCHCALKAPECSQITCLCFQCGRPPET